MCDITFSKEQENIFEYAQKGVDNIVVQAVAGAGKTTTLIECVKRILKHDPTKRILLLAHNKSTRDTLKERLKEERKNVKVYTLHGLAYRLFQEHFEMTPDINDNKYRDYINQNMNNIASEMYQTLKGPSKMMYKANLFELINKARHNLKQSEGEIKKMAIRKYGIPIVADECHLAARILRWGTENLDLVDFQDLLYLPHEKGYRTNKYTADIIFLDEAQDASLAQQDIIKRCFKRNTRLIVFGDRDQTINSWCGSDTEAFDNFQKSENFNKPSKTFPLTTNYRCGKKIIEYAKKYTNNDIKARDDAHEGSINFNVSLESVNNGDMILCRNTAPLMELYRRGIKTGKKMYFRGEELGQRLKESVDCAMGDSIGDIIYNMKKRLIALWDFFTLESGLDARETMLNPSIISLYDTIKTMENLPESISNREKLHNFIIEMFSNEGKEGIQLSTIHRAKGLEADNVFIICPSLIPSRLSQLEWEIEEEKHLQYVMCTRPKNTLNFITEKEIRPSNAYSENNSFYEELINIKNEIKILL